ncbi:MAG: UbiA family prenyltransferase [Actinomycetota bacterium]|nr:UbiA family prenyltransferase [Actinomycetota bacterium]
MGSSTKNSWTSFKDKIDADRFSPYCVRMLDGSLSIDKTADKPAGAARLTEVIRALLGMSRAIVAVFVVAHAGLAAIFATGRVPDIRTIVIGIFACLFGTGALIGLNDLLDVSLDRRRMAAEGEAPELDLGSLFIHHPVAKGVISMSTGLIWVGCLSILSLSLISMLKSGLWPIFLLVAVCVALYSIVGRYTYFKFIFVAMAVTLGALSGWLVVAPANTTTFLLFGAWTYLWEIGGRNVPNDFNDVDEDAALGVKTIPVVLGKARAGKIVFWALLASFLVSLPLMVMTDKPPLFIGGAVLISLYLLLIPGYALMRDPRPQISRKLYNKSAIFPLVLLLLLMVNLLLVR